MTISDAASLKKLLKALGFEVYRTLEGRVLLAERIRDNLIMDSGIAVGPDGEYGADHLDLRITVTLRTQASHFPGSNQKKLETEAATLARPFLDRGYLQFDSGGHRLLDPGDPTQVLDTSHELHLGRTVSESELQGEIEALLQCRRTSSDD